MVSHSPAAPVVAPLSFRALRRALLGLVLLVAVLVAIAGRPPGPPPGHFQSGGPDRPGSFAPRYP